MNWGWLIYALWESYRYFEFFSPRIAGITRIFIREIIVICVQKRNSNVLWSHANLANPAKCENKQFNPCNMLILFFFCQCDDTDETVSLRSENICFCL